MRKIYILETLEKAYMLIDEGLDLINSIINELTQEKHNTEKDVKI